MRRLVVGLWFAMACGGGGGGDSDEPVASLPGASQRELCERFLDEVCQHETFASFCADSCHATGCAMAVDAGHVTTQCGEAPGGGAITEGMVEDCATTGALGVCAEGGGCMFDALEAACP